MLDRLGFVALAVLATGAADAMADDPVFEVHWAINTHWEELAQGNDWAALIELPDDAPYVKDVFLLVSALTGTFPEYGPHMMFADPDFMETHLATLEEKINQNIPEDFDGLAVIDLERWRPEWDRTINKPSELPWDADDKDYKDDWEDMLLADDPGVFDGLDEVQKEEVLRQTWNEVTKDFYLQTILKCKELRPNAKWGYWGFPHRKYLTGETPPHVIGYGDLTFLASDRNDNLDWMWEVQDALFPVTYAFRRTVPTEEDIEDPIWDDLPPENFQFVNTNVAECRRLAPGKPVYPFITFRYAAGNGGYKYQWCNDLSLAQQFEVNRAICADGVVLWGALESEEVALKLQERLDTFMNPLAASVSTPIDPTQCIGCDMDIVDFVQFQSAFVAGDMVADCDNNGKLNMLDFVCFMNIYEAKCD